ncbi:MAG: hypothetical protein E6H10_06400 [Bacteroidetes bacterium]|nr:MAG: hypothetical protein E6H10_06400 [Bacteroidota bacterium]
MRKLTLVVLVILAAKVISFSLVACRPTFDLPVGRMALPTDSSLKNWCVVTGTDRSTVKYSNEVLL